MRKAVSDLTVLLRTLEPVLNEGIYVYSVVSLSADLSAVRTLATFSEAEGLTVITTEAEAVKAGLPVLFRAAWLTLNVQSDLQAVGLTAAVSRVLSDAGISCNVVAAAYHDHIFVPFDLANEALGCLRALQEHASS
jgi:hypothetical protein